MLLSILLHFAAMIIANVLDFLRANKTIVSWYLFSLGVWLENKSHDL